MRYSFMSFSVPGMALKEVLAAAGRYGYAGFEPRIGSGHAHGIETGASPKALKEARSLAQDAGVSICCLATGCVLADPGRKAEQLEQGKRAVELAGALGCPAIRVFGGLISGGVSRERAFETLISSAAELQNFAKGAGVAVCIETHDDWCDPAAASKAARESGAFVNWDIMHSFLEGKSPPERAFELLGPYIRHVHIHDGYYDKSTGKLVFTSIGDGEIDHALPLRLLKENGYAGFVSGEWMGWDPGEVHLPRELALLKAAEERSGT
ncbi:MAG: sugar phosphate isomerase/epimerase [Spirochaetaceae bacterium]|jgi:sugar phosphate isomerase/epimerase|nr:sugar phosphate isomerase/epimerase [Spirochaetaceae bacterium]